MILKKNEKFNFSIFFDENLLSARFKDERPQGLSWVKLAKCINGILYHFMTKKSFFSGFFLMKMVFGII